MATSLPLSHRLTAGFKRYQLCRVSAAPGRENGARKFATQIAVVPSVSSGGRTPVVRGARPAGGVGFAVRGSGGGGVDTQRHPGQGTHQEDRAGAEDRQGDWLPSRLGRGAMGRWAPIVAVRRTARPTGEVQEQLNAVGPGSDRRSGVHRRGFAHEAWKSTMSTALPSRQSSCMRHRLGAKTYGGFVGGSPRVASGMKTLPFVACEDDHPRAPWILDRSLCSHEA